MAPALATVLRPLRVAKAYAQGDELRRLRIRRDELRRVIRRVVPVVVRSDRGIDYVIDLRDESEVTHSIWFYGRYEEPLLARALACLEADGFGDRPLEGRAFVDVGANIGSASFVALLRQGASRAVLCEPHPANLRLLRMGLAANDLASRSWVVPAAISDRGGELVLEESRDNIGDHRIRETDAQQGPGELGEDGRDTRSVTASTLDAALADADLDPADVGLVWVDVQGHEAQVLEGAAGLLAARVPWCVELWPYGLRRAGTLDRLLALLDQHFSHVWDLGTPPGHELAVPSPAGRRVERSELPALAAALSGADASTNLLLVPRR